MNAVTQRQNLHVLIVEDDPINLLIAKKLLEKSFFISTATNDQEALSALETHHFDVILMDINLGLNSQDGVELMRGIREQYGEESPYIFAVTSYAMAEDRQKYLSAGFDRYFPKPIDRSAIVSAIFEDCLTG